MSTNAVTSIQSHEDVVKLGNGTVALEAKYSFNNPYSINGPFGTVDVTLLDEPELQSAVGTVNIQTLYGMGSLTTLHYTGTTAYDGSTGITTIIALGKGTMSAWPNPKKAVTAKIKMTLSPGFGSGTLTVEGFLQDYTLTATSVQVG
jgi:hypothetical protein